MTLLKLARKTLVTTQRYLSSTVHHLITEEDVNKYAQLTGDFNPIHTQNDSKIVHGTYLLGLVSAVMGTKCPGPGTIVISLTSNFVKACPVGTEVAVQVELKEKRKISTAEFKVTDKSTKDLLVHGTAKVKC